MPGRRPSCCHGRGRFRGIRPPPRRSRLPPDCCSCLSVDWLSREPVRAKLRARIRRVLAKFDYPPEEEREAVDLVLKQMETVAALWAPGAKQQ
ncbi:type I restriction enzyme endonuclease domain-containing protein [Streptomyces sp. NPDC015032]|uniref:type I restriction enzyme endonuclease domain-containing protein n=1 Tax=Streptomyces sp. NPDC015032 TaxID=3364937 RepID=UPI0036FE2EB9